MESWEELDIDTSDLAAFVQRCNTDITTHLIPGPTCNVQAAILNRNSTQPQNTQQFMNEITYSNHECDFNTNLWR